MRWKNDTLTGWHKGFAWLPVLCADGTYVWLETFRFYVNDFGVISTVLKG